MPEADTDAVRVEIDTYLKDLEISHVLDRVEREWQREYDSSVFEDTAHIQDFEATLAALRIAEGRDRRASDAQSGRTRQTYETAEIDNLRKRLRRLDPGDKFGHDGSVVRDTDRHVTNTDL